MHPSRTLTQRWLKTITSSRLRCTVTKCNKWSLSTISLATSMAAKETGAVRLGHRALPRAALHDTRSPLSPASSTNSKVISGSGMSGKEVEDLGGDEIKRGEAPEKKPGESDGARHATRFRSLVSEFRTVKKEVAVQEWTPSREPGVDALGRSFGLGRRKSSMARVWVNLSEGDGGVFVVNKRPMIDYFVRDFHQNEILKPLEAVKKMGHFHVRCTTEGGGLSGQAGAIRLGLARALEAHEPFWRKELKKEGLLTRDPRKVERKKPGLKKARKAPQWVKR